MKEIKNPKRPLVYYAVVAMLAVLLMNVFAPLIDYFVVEGNIKRRLKRARKA